jgi:hypothetical protein
VNEVDRPAALAVDLAAPLERALAAGELSPLGAELIYFPVATSTNDLAGRLAERRPGRRSSSPTRRLPARTRRNSWFTPASGLCVW